MRILFVTSVYAPSISGVTTSMQNFKNELERRGHEVYVLAPYHPGYTDTEPHVMRYFSFSNPFVRSYPIPLPIPTIRLLRFLTTTHFDVVHAQHPLYMGTVARLIALWNKAPLVFTYHTRYDAPFLPILDNGLSTELIPRMVDRFCAQTDLVIAPSPFIASFLRTRKQNISIAVVPSPVSDFPKQGKEKNPFSEFQNKNLCACLMVQRLTMEKKTDFAIRAFAKLPAQYHLFIVGDGPERKRLEALVHALGMSGRVHFSGWKSRETVASYYAHADMYIFTSTTETQSMGIVEAASHGLPIVVSDSAFSRSMIPGGVAVRAPLHAELFAKAVFFAHKNREKLRLRAQEWARQFGTSACTDMLEREYEKCITIHSLVESGWQSWSVKKPFSMRVPAHRYNPVGKTNYALRTELFLHPKREYRGMITGWNSWGAYGTRVTEENIMQHVNWMQAHRETIPLTYCVIDDGWTRWGDWRIPRRSRFPHGMKYMVEYMHARGVRAGVWMAPFLASPKSYVAKQFPAWFVRDRFGFPVDGAQFHSFDGMPFLKPVARRLFDIRNPEAWAYIRHSVDFLLKTCGFDLIKLDFLFAPYFIPGIHAYEASEMVQRLLRYVRDTYPHVYVMGSGCPLPDGVGLVDAMRVGPDSVFPWLRARGMSSMIAHALRMRDVEKTVENRLWTQSLWTIDPDVFVCGRGFSLRTQDIIRMQKVIRSAHGAVFLGDDLASLSEKEIKEFIEPLFVR